MKHFLILLCMLCLPFSLMAQQQEITGTVLDSNSEPLIGVTIRVPGSNKATITDMDGNYRIAVNQGEQLEFSYVGFKSQIITANKARIDVTMAEDVNLLDEVIVADPAQTGRIATQSPRAGSVVMADTVLDLVVYMLGPTPAPSGSPAP